jgi:hypothetical protein
MRNAYNLLVKNPEGKVVIRVISPVAALVNTVMLYVLDFTVFIVDKRPEDGSLLPNM